MKTVNNIAFQGDVAFIRVDSIPTVAKEEVFEGNYVVAHSETGHDHVLECPDVKVHRMDPMTAFLTLALEGDVVHRRSFDTHETLRLTPGIWKVQRQREHTPEGWRRVED